MKLRALLIVMLCAASTVSGKEVMDPQRAQQLLAQKALDLPFKTQSTDILINRASNLLESTTTGVLEKEHQLYYLSRAIADRPASDELKQLLTELSQYESKLFWSVQHVGRMKEVLAYPIAGTAASILQDWQLNEQAEALLVNGSLQLDDLAAYLSGQHHPDQTQVFRRLVKRLNQAQLVDLSDWAKIHPSILNSKALVALIRETPDFSLYQILVSQLSEAGRADASIVRSLTQLVGPMDDNMKYRLLSGLVLSPGYGTTALQLIAATASDHEQTNRLLLDKLADRKLGGDAAYALSRRLTPHLINELSLRLHSDQQLLARRAELALTLSDNEQAREVLRLSGAKLGVVKPANGSAR